MSTNRGGGGGAQNFADLSATYRAFFIDAFQLQKGCIYKEQNVLGVESFKKSCNTYKDEKTT